MTIVGIVGQIAIGAWMAPGMVRHHRELRAARRAFGAANVNPIPIIAYGRMAGRDVQMIRRPDGGFTIRPLRGSGEIVVDAPASKKRGS